MKRSLTWLLGVSVFITFVFIAHMQGLLTIVYSDDKTLLTYVVTVMLIVGTMQCGWFTYKMEKTTNLAEKKRVQVKVEHIVGLYITLCPIAGLLGTVIGFMIIFIEYGNVASNEMAGPSAAALVVTSGMPTVLMSTLCGMIAAAAIYIQQFNLTLITLEVYDE